MEKLDVVSRQPDSPPRPLPNGPPPFCGDIGISWASAAHAGHRFPRRGWRQRTVTLVPNLGLIDDNWHLDAPSKPCAASGSAATSPSPTDRIFQWLSSIPARSMPLSVGALYATWNTIPDLVRVPLRLSGAASAPARAAAMEALRPAAVAGFVLGNIVADDPPGAALRAVSARLVRGEEGRMRSHVFAGIAGALLVAIAFLVAGDTGVYATAAWFMCFARHRV